MDQAGIGGRGGNGAGRGGVAFRTWLRAEMGRGVSDITPLPLAGLVGVAGAWRGRGDACPPDKAGLVARATAGRASAGGRGRDTWYGTGAALAAGKRALPGGPSFPGGSS